MLTIDVNFTNSFTFVHYAEEFFKVPYRKHKILKIKYIFHDGKVEILRHLFFKRRIHVANNLDRLEELFLKKGISKKIVINGSSFVVTDLFAAFLEIEMDIKLNGGKKLHKTDIKLLLYNIIKIVLSLLGIYKKHF
jgi:aminoglycoside 3-N-acetyltransferase